MSFLTATTIQIIVLPLPKKTAVGFRSPNGQYSGATAPSNLLGAFFTPRDFPLVVCEGNPSGLPAIAVGVHRSSNPSHAATILFRSIWCQLVLNQTQDTNMSDKITAYMPEDCFTFDPSVDKTKLYDPVYLYIERARAILAMMQDNGQCLSEGFTIPHSVVMFNLDGIDASLTQLKKFIEIQHAAQFDALRKAEEVA